METLRLKDRLLSMGKNFLKNHVSDDLKGVPRMVNDILVLNKSDTLAELISKKTSSLINGHFDNIKDDIRGFLLSEFGYLFLEFKSNIGNYLIQQDFFKNIMLSMFGIEEGVTNSLKTRLVDQDFNQDILLFKELRVKRRIYLGHYFYKINFQY